MTRTVIVTGAGQGLGRAVAERFAREGERVVGLDIKPGEPGANIEYIATDITDPQAVAAAFDSVVERFGRPDVLINAAGVYPGNNLENFTVEQYRFIFDVNVLGTLLVSQAFIRAHDPATEGVLVNIASEDGLKPLGNYLLYSASKAAVVNLTAGSAEELADANIRTVALAPSHIATERLRELVKDMPAHSSTPQQVADTVWAVTGSDSLPLITGQTLITRVTGALDRLATGVS